MTKVYIYRGNPLPEEVICPCWILKSMMYGNQVYLSKVIYNCDICKNSPLATIPIPLSEIL